MATDKLELWNKHKTPDPDFTKEVAFGRKFTSVDATYVLLEATREWGPYGGEWGLRNCRYRVIEAEKTDKHGKVLGKPASMMIEAELFYPGGLVEVAVDLPFRHGEDTCKKLRTAARSKALADLGFAADVYMGKFDDAAYVNNTRDAFSASDELVARAEKAISEAESDEDLDTIRQRVASHQLSGKLTSEDADEILRKIDRVSGSVSKNEASES